MCTVTAKFVYKKSASDELDLDVGETLDIIDNRDPEWWTARNIRGDEGVIPSNYVEVIPNSHRQKKPLAPVPSTATAAGYPGGIKLPAPTLPAKHNGVGAGSGLGNNAQRPNTPPNNGNRRVVEDQDWFHGPLSRRDTESLMLSRCKHGDFLLRASETKQGDYSVSLRVYETVKHFRIVFENNRYKIGPREFSNLFELVDHYKEHPIFTTPANDRIMLIAPFPVQ